ncbi:MAG: PD-(D/E)XK nuclease family protein [Deltaproteobacteria bacterium]|nr:PD-(D/E)XK nuclease family protein [Deltaproteobacteria bacterium]
MAQKLNVMMCFIKDGATVLTVNRRLARYLTNLYDNAMKEAEASCWPTPQIMPTAAWATKLWDTHTFGPPILSALRAKALWEKVILNDKPLSAVSGADDAYRGYTLLNEYCPQETPSSGIGLSEEAVALKRWTTEYEREVKRLGFVEPSLVISKLAARLSSWKGINPVLPKEIVLAGFNELTPSVTSLLDGLKSCGVSTRLWPRAPDFPGNPAAGPSGLEGRLTIRRYADEKEEVIGAARWAREHVKPNMRAAFIVPELEKYRALIEREFARELNPASVLPGQAHKNVFNISLGTPLTEEPLVRSALNILSVSPGKNETAKLFAALLSPFFSAEPERLILAAVDMRLRRENRSHSSLREIGIAATMDGGAALIKRLGAWLERINASGKKLLPSAWALELSATLKDAGWPGQTGLSSVEHQARAAWNGVLEAFASLDDVLGVLTRTEAVSRLSRDAQDTIHQPETPEAAIQVLGLLEASGQSFDRIWFMGCHDFALPPELSPNPFIPPDVRKKYNLPHASHEREFKFISSVLGRLIEGAHPIEVSYPAVVEEKEMRLSPFFHDAGAVIEEPASRGCRLVDAVQTGKTLEDVPADSPIPPTEKELSTVTGGTAIIKDQSHCPFKAFAAHRLHAASVPSTEFGLSLKQRGAILHRALWKFWDNVGDSGRLNAMTEDKTLEKIIKSAADESFSGIILAPQLAPVIALEKERLCALLNEWAALELKRGRFKVKKMETENKFTIAGLTIKEKPDRVDVLEDGKEAVIDYKSANDLSINGWLTERPKDPQLIIYCLSGKFQAMTFAKVMPGDCRFVGVAIAPDIMPGLAAYEQKKWKGAQSSAPGGWDGLTQFWRGAIETIAAEFVAGVCEVSPNGDPPNLFEVCRYCKLPSLCRVFEMEGEFKGEE